jgi:large subunit ribosomal protein L31
MKAGIHPELHVVKVHCGCGNEFETLSTTDEIRLELCGACHPFYTGKKRAMAAQGQVQKYQDKYKGAQTVGAKTATSKAKTKKS